MTVTRSDLPCPLCRGGNRHWAGCPRCPEQRRQSLAAINSLGAIIDPGDIDTAAGFCVFLPYDPETQKVLRGPHRGQKLAEAEWDAATLLLARFEAVAVQTVTLCPWWRWWLFTPARRLTPCKPRAEVPL